MVSIVVQFLIGKISNYLGEDSYVLVEYYPSIIVADEVSTKTTFRLSGDSEEKLVTWLTKSV